ncbi:MAG: ankyrin repeat domain-containing protein [Vicinamibacterales bacterium]
MSPSRQLPDRPSLEHLKKDAKRLLRDAQIGDTEALRRFASLPAYSGLSAAALQMHDLKLHDAQSVVAREHGFDSWTALRDEIETGGLSLEAAADALAQSATDGGLARARHLLARYPAVTRASWHAALVSGDAEAAWALLDADPSLATRVGGPRNWPPLLYVCHTCLHRDAPDRAAALVEIARELLARGADPNAEFHWNWHPELPRTALWGALCAMRLVPLATLLLEAGARPTDGVTGHIAAGGGDLEALELLRRFGFDPNGLAGGVPPLAYMLTWSDTPDGARWLVEHGADPNRPWGEKGDTPLHLAAQRWDIAMADLLVTHGADVNARRLDGATPHTVAALQGNVDVANWLLENGAADERTPLERFVSACAQGNAAAADALLASHPSFRDELRAEHHRMLDRPAERGEIAILETMLTRGFDPRVGDKDQVTPLHRAAMAGQVEATRVLLAHGAPIDALDGMFAATPLVWAVEGRRHAGDDADHVGVARVLIAAGSPLDWAPPEGAPDVEGTLDGLAAIRSEAARSDA